MLLKYLTSDKPESDSEGAAALVIHWDDKVDVTLAVVRASEGDYWDADLASFLDDLVIGEAVGYYDSNGLEKARVGGVGKGA
jgi:hypothetical protein